ncbi:MAG: hypothetical protein ACUVSX_14080 [Aggregatilineales bacterium]
MVALRAGETITEFALALALRLNTETLAKAIHVYPAYASGVQLALADIALEKALSGPIGRLLKALARPTGLTNRTQRAKLAETPPSTLSIAPVVLALRGPARKAIASARSSG